MILKAESPLDYMAIVREINFLGITLSRATGKTRAANGEKLVRRFQKKLNVYKSGRHSPLICKPYTANVFLLSKISYRSGVICLRASDIHRMQSALKQWVCQKQCPTGSRTRPDTRYFFRYPTRLSFENHRTAGNPKYRVLPDISGKPGVSGITRYFG